MPHLKGGKIYLEAAGNPSLIPIVNPCPYSISSGGIFIFAPIASEHLVEARVSKKDFYSIEKTYGEGVKMVVLSEADEILREIEIPENAYFTTEAWGFDQRFEYWLQWRWLGRPDEESCGRS